MWKYAWRWVLVKIEWQIVIFCRSISQPICILYVLFDIFDFIYSLVIYLRRWSRECASIFHVKLYRNIVTAHARLREANLSLSQLYIPRSRDERTSGSGGPPCRARAPAGRSEWTKGPIDLTQNEITSSFPSVGGIFDNSRGMQARSGRKSGRPASWHAPNGANFFLYGIWFFRFTRRGLQAVDVTLRNVYVSAFWLHYLEKRKYGFSAFRPECNEWKYIAQRRVLPCLIHHG